MAKSVDHNKARQGRRGWQILVILVCSLALLMLVWWGVEYYGSAIEPEDPVGAAPIEAPEAVTD